MYHKRKKSRTLSIGDSSSQPATPTVATSAEAVAGTSVLVIDSPTSASPAVLKKPENKTPPERGQFFCKSTFSIALQLVR